MIIIFNFQSVPVELNVYMDVVVKQSHLWFKNVAEYTKTGKILLDGAFDSMLDIVKDHWRDGISKMLEIVGCNEGTIKIRLEQIEIYQKMRDAERILYQLAKIKDHHKVTSELPKLARIKKTVRYTKLKNIHYKLGLI